MAPNGPKWTQTGDAGCAVGCYDFPTACHVRPEVHKVSLTQTEVLSEQSRKVWAVLGHLGPVLGRFWLFLEPHTPPVFVWCAARTYRTSLLRRPTSEPAMFGR
uniref:Uncharacterized protein n=1 Tax=Eutreptiella gymnastica TaxID=73025 RepID=A0A6U7WWD5_9EUGL|mmetsp:Transcript_13692/g.24466  ORF Transcript_13692/g.24466 Transcript_13692/m.24466 type:complete len:103 (+) Transcript_13692:358-666(+)